MEACSGVMEMLMEIMKAQQEASTSPAPGTEMQAMLGMMCEHQETLSCIASTPECAEGGEDDSMGMITCFCDCPHLSALMSGGEDGMKSMCANPGMLECMFDKESCKPLTAQMGEDMAKMDTAMMKKSLAIACKREELNCDEKLETAEECAGDMMVKWGEAGCGDTVTEECCPWGKTIVNCMGMGCVQLQYAMQKIGADAGDEDSAKELKQNYKIAEKCSDLGLPTNDGEADALVAATTGTSEESDDAPPATSFACHAAPVFAAAATLCAVVA